MQIPTRHSEEEPGDGGGNHPGGLKMDPFLGQLHGEQPWLFHAKVRGFNPNRSYISRTFFSVGASLTFQCFYLLIRLFYLAVKRNSRFYHHQVNHQPVMYAYILGIFTIIYHLFGPVGPMPPDPPAIWTAWTAACRVVTAAKGSWSTNQCQFGSKNSAGRSRIRVPFGNDQQCAMEN